MPIFFSITFVYFSSIFIYSFYFTYIYFSFSYLKIKCIIYFTTMPFYFSYYFFLCFIYSLIIFSCVSFNSKLHTNVNLKIPPPLAFIFISYQTYFRKCFLIKNREISKIKIFLSRSC